MRKKVINTIVIFIAVIILTALSIFGHNYILLQQQAQELKVTRDSLLVERAKLLLQLDSLATQDTTNINRLNYAKEIRHKPGAINFYELPLSAERNAKH